MTFRQALKLHNEDEVTCKRTKAVLRVLDVELDVVNKAVFIHCDDGQCYHHTAVK